MNQKTKKNILSYQIYNKKFVSTYNLVNIISKYVNSKHVIIPGSSGSCSDIFMQTYRSSKGITVQNAPGLGAMGTGIPSIVGAHFAERKKMIVSIIGDGGFQFNLQELQTIKNLKINTSIFVLNNNGYASIRRSQLNHFKRKAHCDIDSSIILTNLRLVSNAFGFEYLKFDKHTDLESMVKRAVAQKKQLIIEVMIDPEEDVRPRVGAKIINGKIISGNLNSYI